MSILLHDIGEIVDLVVQVHYETVQDISNTTIPNLDIQDISSAQISRYRQSQRDLYNNPQFMKKCACTSSTFQYTIPLGSLAKSPIPCI